LFTDDETWRDFYSYYLTFNIQDEKLLIAGYRHLSGSSSPPVWNEDVFFCYSEDKGQTWKFANGTTFSPPVDVKQAVVFNTSSSEDTGVAGVCLNSEKQIVISANWWSGSWVSHYSRYLQIFVSNKTVGSINIGFNRYNVTLEDGSLVRGNSKVIFDYYYNQPSFWVGRYHKQAGFPDTDVSGGVAKIVCTGRSDHEFREVYYTSQDDFGVLGTKYILRARTTYDTVLLERKIRIGWRETGSTQWDAATGYIYGTKFTASSTCKVAGIQIRIKTILTGCYQAKVAIYNSTLHKIVASDATQVGPTAGTWDSWSMIAYLPQITTLEAGKEYYLCVRLQSSAMDLFYSTATGYTTIVKEMGWADSWPDQITDYTTYSSRRLSIYAEEVRLTFRGYGADNPIPKNIWINSTQPETKAEFRIKWWDITGLDQCDFYWNASGTMQYNGTYTFTGEPIEGNATFVRWLNFTSETVIAWYAVANDTLGFSGNTTVQYLQVGVSTELVVGWNTINETEIDNYDVGKTLGQVNASLNYDGINWTFIVLTYANGTQGGIFIYGEAHDANVVVLAGSKLEIWCNEAGTWYHQYP